MRDACRRQRGDLRPQRVEHLVGDVRGVDVGEADAGGRPADEQCSAGPGGARDDDGRRPDARPLGEEDGVRLVLDVLEAGQVDRRATVLVEDARQQLRQELRVGFVAAEDADRQRPVVVAGEHGRGTGRTGRTRAARPRPARRARRARTRSGRWSAGRRASRTPRARARRHPSRGTTRRGSRRGARCRDTSRRGPSGSARNQPSRRTGRVRYGDAAASTATITASRTSGKAGRVVAEPGDDVERLGETLLADDERTDEPGGDPGDDAGEREIAREAPPVCDERGRDHDRERPERAGPVEEAEERPHAVGQVVEEREDVAFGARSARPGAG